MKHGDKAKSKASKASGKKASKTGGQSRQAASSKAKQTRPSKSSTKSVPKSSAGQGGNGKSKGRTAPEAVTFTNPTVAAAFKRAVKKFPNAFRRLTD